MSHACACARVFVLVRLRAATLGCLESAGRSVYQVGLQKGHVAGCPPSLLSPLPSPAPPIFMQGMRSSLPPGRTQACLCAVRQCRTGARCKGRCAPSGMRAQSTTSRCVAPAPFLVSATLCACLDARCAGGRPRAHTHHTHTHMHARTHTRTHARTHAHMHTRVHTRTHSPLPSLSFRPPVLTRPQVH